MDVYVSKLHIKYKQHEKEAIKKAVGKCNIYIQQVLAKWCWSLIVISAFKLVYTTTKTQGNP
jgi:hypothetical protein